jgi:hypothetical protein
LYKEKVDLFSTKKILGEKKTVFHCDGRSWKATEEILRAICHAFFPDEYIAFAI